MLDFDKMQGLVPAIVQDSSTGRVLMLGFMNKEAYEKTIKDKRVTFYSREKKKLWTKGETSGNFLEVKEILPDCDNDTILIKAIPSGPVCHTGKTDCFNQATGQDSTAFLSRLSEIIKDRKKNPVEGSYNSKLFKQGLNRIAQKVGEEAVEVVIAAKDNDEAKFLDEAADLLFHYMVLLEEKGQSLSKVAEILRSRNK